MGVLWSALLVQNVLDTAGGGCGPPEGAMATVLEGMIRRDDSRTCSVPRVVRGCGEYP